MNDTVYMGAREIANMESTPGAAALGDECGQSGQMVSRRVRVPWRTPTPTPTARPTATTAAPRLREDRARDCGCGVADTDTDSDGTPDYYDSPSDPEDRAR